MRMPLWTPLLLSLWALCPAAVHAHALGDSALNLTLTQGQVQGDWSLQTADLSALLSLDHDGDGRVSAMEFEQGMPRMRAYLQDRITLAADNEHCPLGDMRLRREQPLGESDQLHLAFSAQCPAQAEALEVHYDLFFEHDRDHRGFLQVKTPAGPIARRFDRAHRTQTVPLRSTAQLGTTLSGYLVQGAYHIAIGLDHVLFVIVLLLPAFADGRSRMRLALHQLFRVISAFTGAHSLTLILSTLDLVRLPAAPVEIAIAMSIVVAALLNLRTAHAPRGQGPALAFVFGLVHGFGFSNALSALDMPESHFVAALLGFNLGVELGQLALISLFLPLAFLFGGTATYRRIFLQGGSLLAGGIAALWALERAFNITVFDRLGAFFGHVDPAAPVALLGAGLCLLSILGARSQLDWLRRRRHVSTIAATLGGLLVIGGYAVSAADNARKQQEQLQKADAAARSAARERHAGRMDEAQRASALAKMFYAAAGDRASSADMAVRLGDLALFSAAFAVARSEYEEALSLRREIEDARGVASTHKQLSLVAQLSGDSTAAARHLRLAVGIEDRLGLAHRAVETRLSLAEAYLRSRQPTAARTAVERVSGELVRLNAKQQQVSRAQLARIYAQLDSL